MKNIIEVIQKEQAIRLIRELAMLYNIKPLEIIGRERTPFYDRMDTFNRLWKEMK